MFFHFNQNNSGGHFTYSESDGITHNVIIEAKDAEDANSIAIQKGIYFDGCDNGQDCSCCGDRWYRSYREKGDAMPSVYGEPLGVKRANPDFSFADKGWMKPGRETAVHYADGRIEWFNADNTKATT